MAPFPHPLIEPDLRIARNRLSDKTSRLRPRHVVPKPAQAYEPVVPVEVREWVAPAPSSPDFVLGAQPHCCVSVERPIRLADGSYLEVVRPSAQRTVQPYSPALWSLAMFPLGRSGRGLSRPRAECFSLTAGSRYGPRRSSPKTFARTCIPGSRTRLPALCRSVSSPRSPSASASRRQSCRAVFARACREPRLRRQPRARARTASPQSSRPSRRDATAPSDAGVESEVLGRTSARTSKPIAAPFRRISRPRSASKSSTSRQLSVNAHRAKQRAG
jgi:hypothetical protein